MIKKHCALCKISNFSFMITFCKSHPDYPMVISLTHKMFFNKAEKDEIKRLFPENFIDWEMRSIPDHAHCHIVPKGKDLR